MKRAKPNSQIRSALTAYCRGVDRLDVESLTAAFHPGATLEGYGPKAYPIERFAPFAMQALPQSYEVTQHRLSNTTIERDGDKARVETYVLAFHVTAAQATADGARQLVTFNGRYIDDFEAVDGVWRIRTRRLRHDWSSTDALGAPMAGVFQSGARDRSDAVYLPL